MFMSFVFLAIALWLCSGIRKIPVGYRGLVLFLGKRTVVVREEGWTLIPLPFPWGLTIHDCRQRVFPLNNLNKVFTKDDVEVTIDGSRVSEITDLHKFLSVKPEDIEKGLSDIWAQEVRTQLRTKELEAALEMNIELGEGVLAQMAKVATKEWGITVHKILVSSIQPNKEVTADLELQKREGLQKIGQLTEAKHMIELINLFKASEQDGGAGVNPSTAEEMAQQITGKANARNLSTYGISPEVLVAAAKILGRKEE